MFQMDIETLKKYEDYAKPLTENDKKQVDAVRKNGTAGRREKTHHLYVTKRNKAGTGMYFRIPVRSIDHVETKTDF